MIAHQTQRMQLWTLCEEGSIPRLMDIFNTQLSEVMKKKKTLRLGEGGQARRLVHHSTPGSKYFDDLHREKLKQKTKQRQESENA